MIQQHHRCFSSAAVDTIVQRRETSAIGRMHVCLAREQFFHNRVAAIEHRVMKRCGIVPHRAHVEEFWMLIENALQ